uniref:NADH dehydrogenase subunit 6 n=1 Tax=Lucanus prometheus TaxID=618055 RepID=UPI001EDD13D6|nr:NADH dehydrogenase subunit 6 [Lucanus prometheus]UIN24754.1 NADH dehydrogenase subunit 6 [Lucanus prometheus]
MLTILGLTTIPPAMAPFMNHPLSLGILLLSEVLLIVLAAGLSTPSYWFSYLMFLIMIGGMLVIFMYMTSVASNEKFRFSWMTGKICLLGITVSILIQTFAFSFNFIKPTQMENIKNSKSFFFSINKLMNEPSITLSVILIIYLLITLIAVIKIININFGPIRHMN